VAPTACVICRQRIVRKGDGTTALHLFRSPSASQESPVTKPDGGSRATGAGVRWAAPGFFGPHGRGRRPSEARRILNGRQVRRPGRLPVATCLPTGRQPTAGISYTYRRRSCPRNHGVGQVVLSPPARPSRLTPLGLVQRGFGHAFEAGPVHFPGGSSRHLVEHDDLLWRLVPDLRACEPDQLQVGGPLTALP
jgi:hypothetical protein